MKKTAIILTTLALVTIGVISHQNMVRHRKETSAKAVLTLLTTKQQLLSDQILDLLQRWANEIETNSYIASNPCTSEIINEINAQPLFSTYRVIAKNGISVCSNTDHLQLKVDVSNDAEFQEFMIKKGFYVSDFRTGLSSGINLVAFGYPAFNQYNKENVDYGLFIGLKLDELNEMIGSLGLPKDTDLMITDTDGKILVNFPTDKSKIGTYSFGPRKLSIVLAGKKGSLREKGEDGILRTYVYSPINLLNTEEVHMFVILGIPN